METLVTVLVVGLLAAIVLPNMMSHKKSTDTRLMRSQMDTAAGALGNWAQQNVASSGAVNQAGSFDGLTAQIIKNVTSQEATFQNTTQYPTDGSIYFTTLTTETGAPARTLQLRSCTAKYFQSGLALCMELTLHPFGTGSSAPVCASAGDMNSKPPGSSCRKTFASDGTSVNGTVTVPAPSTSGQWPSLPARNAG
jgi:type II secretory pathway pseudopilin PulG